MEDNIGLWLGAIFTFGIYSILYRENAYYRLSEHIFIGLANGLGFYLTWKDTLLPFWWEPMVGKGQWWWVLALICGFMFYFIYSKKNGWISRLIMGGMMAQTAGAAFQDFANMYFPMIRSSFKTVIPTSYKVGVPEPGVGIDMALNNLVFIIVLITVMSYFFFSIDHKKKSMRTTASLGRWFLMFAFGAMFGSTVMARMALFIGRVDFLTTEWGPIVPLWFWWILAGGIMAIVAYFILRPRPPKKMEPEPGEELSPPEPVAGAEEAR
jgi:hypothetical protein